MSKIYLWCFVGLFGFLSFAVVGCGKVEQAPQGESLISNMSDDQLFDYLKIKYNASPAEGGEYMQTYLSAFPKGKHMGEATALLELANEAEGELSEHMRLVQIDSIRIAIDVIGTSIDLYESDNGRLPDDLRNLVIHSNESNWNGPYLRRRESLIDSWGTEFKYTRDGNTYTVISAGPDKTFGTDDDIK